MTARHDLAESVEGGERDADQLARYLAPLLRSSAMRHIGDGVITHAARRAILRDYDAFSNGVLYPIRRGVRSLAEIAIERRKIEVARKPIAAEVARIRHILRDEPELLARMERGRSD